MTDPNPWSAHKQVPEDHIDAGEAAFRALRTARHSSADPPNLRPSSNFKPWRLDIEYADLADSYVETVVYATIYDALLANLEFWDLSKYVYRGHADAKWLLAPTARRHLTAQASSVNRQRQADFLSFVVEQLPLSSDFEKEALCQHYGIPTDLLDVTTSIDVAAFFSSDEDVDYNGFGCIWVFDRNLFELNGTLLLPTSDDGRFNQRLHLQKGGFLRLPAAGIQHDTHGVRALVFGHRTASTCGHFYTDQGLVTKPKLFPPDAEDKFAQFAKKLLAGDELVNAKLRQLEKSREAAPSEKRDDVQRQIRRLIDDGHNLSGLTGAIKQVLEPSSRLFAVEELAWCGRASQLLGFLDSCHDYDLVRKLPPWQLVGDELLLAISAIRAWAAPQQDPNQEQADFFWKICHRITYWMRELYDPEPAQTLLSIFGVQGSWIFRERWTNERLQVANALPFVDDELSLRERQLAILRHDIEAWFWIERDKEVLDVLKHKMDGGGEVARPVAGDKREFRRFDTDRRSRFPLVHPRWKYESTVMIWDAVISPGGDLIAAASTDCNVYLVDFNGVQRGRIVTETEVRQVAFLDDGNLLTNSLSGYVTSYRLSRSGSDVVHEPAWRCQIGGEESMTPFSVRGRDVLCGFGDNDLGEGGVALLTPNGNKVWSCDADASIAMVAAVEGRGDIVGVASGYRADKRFSVYLIGRDGSLKEIMQTAYAAIAGVSADGGKAFVGHSRDGTDCELAIVDAGTGTWISVPTEEFPLQAISLGDHGLIAATCTSIDPDQDRCNVSVWSTAGKPIWRRGMIEQTLQLIFDAKHEVLLVSSLGQGNVYSLNLAGDVLACAKVHQAPMRFVLDPASDTLLVASAHLTSFELSKFATAPREGSKVPAERSSSFWRRLRWSWR